MSNRSEMVQFYAQYFHNLLFDTGVTQGSILGSLLFIKFTNYLITCVTSCKTHLFVDDTQLYFFLLSGVV